jgi:hypothetical protein
MRNLAFIGGLVLMPLAAFAQVSHPGTPAGGAPTQITPAPGTVQAQPQAQPARAQPAQAQQPQQQQVQQLLQQIRQLDQQRATLL